MNNKMRQCVLSFSNIYAFKTGAIKYFSKSGAYNFVSKYLIFSLQTNFCIKYEKFCCWLSAGFTCISKISPKIKSNHWTQMTATKILSRSSSTLCTEMLYDILNDITLNPNPYLVAMVFVWRSCKSIWVTHILCEFKSNSNMLRNIGETSNCLVPSYGTVSAFSLKRVKLRWEIHREKPKPDRNSAQGTPKGPPAIMHWPNSI